MVADALVPCRSFFEGALTDSGCAKACPSAFLAGRCADSEMSWLTDDVGEKVLIPIARPNNRTTTTPIQVLNRMGGSHKHPTNDSELFFGRFPASGPSS